MKVKNIVSSKGNAIPNQFIIMSKSHSENQYACDEVYFQSYDSIIVKQTYGQNKEKIQLDINKWDYSVTTGRYRNQFLGETKAETQKKIDSGEYELVDLN